MEKDMKISVDNVGKIRIVMPENPSATERFAGEELVKYIYSITGAKLTESADKELYSIIVGCPSHNRKAGRYVSEEEFLKVCPGPEGIFIKSYPDALIVAGSEGEYDRGTLYAVYELLERYFGCSLSAYSAPDVKAGEYVPVLDELSLDDIDYVKAGGDLPYRTACIQYEDENGNVDCGLNTAFFDWAAKNRYNRIETWTTCYDKLKALGLLPEIEKRGLRLEVGHHSTSKLLIPPRGNAHFSEHYYETHPEYYRLLPDGTRYESKTPFGQWIFCSRNDDVIRTLAENMKIWLRENPLIDIVFFPPNDGFEDQCTCEECSKHSKVDNYIHVMNGVARLIKDEFPDVRINILVYLDLFDCPDEIYLEPNIMVQESTWHVSGLRKAAKNDGSCLIGTFFEDNLLKWKEKTGAHVTFYEYYMSVFGGRQRYTPMADEIQPIFKAFTEKGIDGSLTQIECFNLWNHIFNFFVFGRTGYDVTLTLEDNLSRFTRIFGEGAEEIKEIIRYAEGFLEGQEDIQQSGRWLINNIDKEKVYALYEKALEKTTGALERNNIRMMRMVFRYTDLEANIKALDEAYKPVGEYSDPTGEFNKIASFDSFWKNYYGYGIDIPGRAVEDVEYKDDKWYEFD